MNWKDYENKVENYFKSRFPDCKIDRNILLKGRLSMSNREVDILLTSTIFGCSMQLIIECKNWKSKLDVADIGSFIDKLNDIGISKGIIISKHGYSESAYKRARSEVNVQLQVLNFDNMPDFYGFWANAYRGNFGAIISAPNGWVVNNKVPFSQRLDMLCYIHPMEFDIETAANKRHYMYFQIFPILNKENNLSNTLKEQDDIVKQKYSIKEIIYWNENIKKGKITYRKIIFKNEDYVEFTGAVECDDFLAYCVCIMPLDFNPDDIARLKYVMSELHLIKIEGLDPTNAHETWRKIF